MFSNNIFISRNSKTYEVSSKLLQRQSLFINARKQPITQTTDYLSNTEIAAKQLHLSRDNTSYRFSPLICAGLKNKKAKDFNKMLRVQKNDFSMLSPKLITAYICALLNKNSKFRSELLWAKFSPSIPVLLTRLLQPFKTELLGAKIILSGRWRKTKSGRKQKLCIKYGRVRKSSVSNIIMFDYATQKTKFGACGIKV